VKIHPVHMAHPHIDFARWPAAQTPTANQLTGQDDVRPSRPFHLSSPALRGWLRAKRIGDIIPVDPAILPPHGHLCRERFPLGCNLRLSVFWLAGRFPRSGKRRRTTRSFARHGVRAHRGAGLHVSHGLWRSSESLWHIQPRPLWRPNCPNGHNSRRTPTRIAPLSAFSTSGAYHFETPVSEGVFNSDSALRHCFDLSTGVLKLRASSKHLSRQAGISIFAVVFPVPDDRGHKHFSPEKCGGGSLALIFPPFLRGSGPLRMKFLSSNPQQNNPQNPHGS